jgi:hypothetical protein
MLSWLPSVNPMNDRKVYEVAAFPRLLMDSGLIARSDLDSLLLEFCESWPAAESDPATSIRLKLS